MGVGCVSKVRVYRVVYVSMYMDMYGCVHLTESGMANDEVNSQFV